MIKQIELMREQQAQTAADAAAAQRKAMVDAQDNAARLGMNQANTSAEQSLMRMNEYQKSQDSMKLADAQAQAAGLGGAITGGAFDVNAMNQSRLANLGQASPLLPGSDSNLAGSGVPTRNPVPMMANKFVLPNTSGLTLGGA
jgi:hypothetical protein